MKIAIMAATEATVSTVAAVLLALALRQALVQGPAKYLELHLACDRAHDADTLWKIISDEMCYRMFSLTATHNRNKVEE